MRDLGVLTRAALQSETGKFFWFIEMEFDQTHRYTDCDIDLYATTVSGGGLNKFEAMPFNFDSIKYTAKSSVDKLKIDIQNTNLLCSAITLNEDIRNKWVTVWVAFIDEDNKIIETPFETFKGLVDTWALNEGVGSITLVNEFVFWNKKVMRKHSSSCPWVFKGTECGYSGPVQDCDRSYSKCRTLVNTDNFGGFRWLSVLSERDIYWGRAT